MPLPLTVIARVLGEGAARLRAGRQRPRPTRRLRFAPIDRSNNLLENFGRERAGSSSGDRWRDFASIARRRQAQKVRIIDGVNRLGGVS